MFWNIQFVTFSCSNEICEVCLVTRLWLGVPSCNMHIMVLLAIVLLVSLFLSHIKGLDNLQHIGILPYKLYIILYTVTCELLSHIKGLDKLQHIGRLCSICLYIPRKATGMIRTSPCLMLFSCKCTLDTFLMQSGLIKTSPCLMLFRCKLDTFFNHSSTNYHLPYLKRDCCKIF